MERAATCADTILTGFFAERRADTTGRRLERVERVERALRRCLETDGEYVLTDFESDLLWAERQFEPTGAVGRVA